MCNCEVCGRPCACGDRLCEICILDEEDEVAPATDHAANKILT
jgi:hypothetical protein